MQLCISPAKISVMISALVGNIQNANLTLYMSMTNEVGFPQLTRLSKNYFACMISNKPTIEGALLLKRDLIT